MMSNNSATSARVVVSDTEIEYSPARLAAKLTPLATARATRQLCFHQQQLMYQTM